MTNDATRHSSFGSAAGHTLIELVVAMVSSAVLMAGLGSVMLIARQVAYTPSGATRRTEAANVLSLLADEVQYATQFVGQSAAVLEFVVSDRNADGAAERIRYEWTGTSGDKKLYKSLNGSTASVIAEDVYDCNFELQSVVVPDSPAARTFFTHALVRLRIGLTGHSRVEAAIPLLSRPERLAPAPSYWRTDFNSAPTAIDHDRDTNFDWVAGTGATFVANVDAIQSPGELSDGTWYANGDLATNLPNDFTTVTIVEARCKNMAAAGVDADVLRVNADRNGAAYAALVIRMRRELDGSQTLQILGLPTNGVPIDLPDDSDTASILAANRVENLADDYVRFRLTILPTLNKVSLQVNDVDVGVYTYQTDGPSSSDRCVKLLGSGGGKFDYVEVRVLPN